MHNLKRRDFLTLLKAALVVSLVLSYSSCVYAEADFSYLDFNQTKSIKLVNPLYLDNSKIERPVIKLTTPYSGEFSESDYFSSEINDTSASEETLTPLREAKQEIKPNKDSPPQENSNSPPEEILDFSRTVNQNSPPNEEVHDFFTPPIQPSELMNEPDEVYSAGVDTDEEVDLNGKTISNIQEVKTRGAFVMAVTTVGNTEVEKVADYVVYLPETNPIFANSLAIIPLQLFGYYVSIGRGLDVDKPRNLAKSVTVE